MRADLERIKKMIDEFVVTPYSPSVSGAIEENVILRELLTSWQALHSSEYQTDVKLHLNMLTKRMLNDDTST